MACASTDAMQELQAKPLATTVGQAQAKLSTEAVQISIAEKMLLHCPAHRSAPVAVPVGAIVVGGGV